MNFNLIQTTPFFQEKARGSYNTFNFVLRLRSDVRLALQSEEYSQEKLSASSTNLHENIHWWQHIGSNFGFIQMLAYPSFFHITLNEFKNLIKSKTTVKPIIKYENEYFSSTNKTDITSINIILNYYHDINYALKYSFCNKAYLNFKDERFFNGIDHAYYILWSNAMDFLAGSFDKNYTFLPQIANYKLSKEILQSISDKNKLQVTIIGIGAIFEGQAIFNQMQYLVYGSEFDITLQDFRNRGMLHGIYEEAFLFFLKYTGFEEPLVLQDPIIGLFLIVCDISINSNNGFPLKVYDSLRFVHKNDPASRFYELCLVISKNRDYYSTKVNEYSKEEYIFLSKELNEAIGCKCSYNSILEVLKWKDNKTIEKLLEEEEQELYNNANLPVRVLFSKYIRYQEDKYKNPNFFCWPGYHTIKNNNITISDALTLFQKHHALYVDDFDGEIKPTLYKNKNPNNIYISFNTFYSFNIMYDLAWKWVGEDGDFDLSYGWLLGERADMFKTSIRERFEKQYNVDMSNIVIL